MNCYFPLPYINAENYYFFVPKVCAVKIISILKRGGGRCVKGISKIFLHIIVGIGNFTKDIPLQL